MASGVNNATKENLKLCIAGELGSSLLRILSDCGSVFCPKSEIALDFCNSLINVQAMSNLRNVILAVVLFLCIGPLVAQTRDATLSRAGILQKMYAGGLKALSWYDAPVAAADVAELLLVSPNASGRPIKFPPSTFDKDLQSRIGVHGSQTIIGRIGDAGMAALFGTRLLVNIGADLTGGNVTVEDYHRTFWFYKSIVYTYSVTMLTKNLVYRMRPDGSDSESFFSGHSSTAFCTASYLSLELNDWYERWETTRSNDALRSTLKIGSGIALYTGATYVAYSRLHDEKHYFTDVAVGAAVGTVVGTLMYHRHWKNSSSTNQDLSLGIVGMTPTIFYTLRL